MRRFSAAQLLTRQQFLKLAGLGGAGVAVMVIVQAFQNNSSTCTASPSPKELSLKIFDFNVVTVDARGKEIKRNRKQAKFFTEDLGNGVNLEMVSIPGGKFNMGSPSQEANRDDTESPKHTVTLQPFFMGKFTVTQAQWRVVAGLPKVKIDLDPDPSRFKGAKRPVEQVSWDDAIEFCARLYQKTGRQYRLPSEAEWEYSARAGTTTPFHFGETITTDLANYYGLDRTINGTLYKGSYADGPRGIYRHQTTEVGSFPANAFGLYDMHGNVWEWCKDIWHENYQGAPTDGSAWLSKNDNDSQPRLSRGGSWLIFPVSCRSAYRAAYNPGGRIGNSVGIRVVCGAEWIS